MRSICLYLRQKDTRAIETHKDIEATLGADTISYSPVTKSLRETQIRHNSEPTEEMSIEDERQWLIDEASLMALAEEPLASVRQPRRRRFRERQSTVAWVDRLI
jgi:hypothetical protein